MLVSSLLIDLFVGDQTAFFIMCIFHFRIHRLTDSHLLTSNILTTPGIYAKGWMIGLLWLGCWSCSHDIEQRGPCIMHPMCVVLFSESEILLVTAIPTTRLVECVPLLLIRSCHQFYATNAGQHSERQVSSTASVCWTQTYLIPQDKWHVVGTVCRYGNV